MKAHDLLGISLEDLKKIDDNALRKAYEQKKSALNAMRDIEANTLNQKEEELKDAFFYCEIKKSESRI